MPSLDKLNNQLTGKDDDSEDTDEKDEAKEIMELLAEEEWILAMVSKNQVALGKKA